MEKTNSADYRAKKITQTGFVGIATNVLLVIGKAIVGFIAGSVSVILDAFNNLTDAISSIITIIGIKLAKRKPTAKHPYGFGRVEYFSAIIIAAIILGTGITSMVESIQKIITPTETSFTVASAVIIGVAIVVKIILGLYTRAMGKKYNSDSLVASGVDAIMDSIVSAATLGGIIANLIWNVNIDGWIGAIISIMIIKAGLEMLLESISDILGARPEAEITKAIKADVCSIEGVDGAYDLILHNYGPDRAIGSVHVEISSNLNAEQIHSMTMRIQNLIMEKYHVVMTVGIYAVDAKEDKNYEIIRNIVKGFDGALGCHGFFINHEEKFLSFDVLVDFTVKDKPLFIKEITEKVLAEFPRYRIYINLDQNYSD